jgi:cell division protein FtsL
MQDFQQSKRSLGRGSVVMRLSDKVLIVIFLVLVAVVAVWVFFPHLLPF